ncbi:uncharacterized protein LOC113849375 [Abrus precatorius]|uniref:Uncharacterized protein LOC113849375 n=1 Tax=Abrus precatorius TaxID=3816 RepID=A0A8B8JUE8_ABRPR|nr:uncharacterized protein LOC113849375 [Abrus precatorius]
MANLLLRFPIAVAIVLLALFATATARPCRTFIISSYSFRNPSSNTFATITEIRSLTPLYYINDKPYDLFFHPIPRQNLAQIDDDQGASHPRAPLGFSSAYDFSSLRDRTKDILSVALALLFGVGCGALTAATMYLVWSVFSTRHDYRTADYDDFSDDDEIESAKKLGYVKIPAAEAAAPAPAKSSV